MSAKFDKGQRVTLSCDRFPGLRAVVIDVLPEDESQRYECAYNADGSPVGNSKSWKGLSSDWFAENEITPGWQASTPDRKD